jgi:hypothetical protein
VRQDAGFGGIHHKAAHLIVSQVAEP